MFRNQECYKNIFACVLHSLKRSLLGPGASAGKGADPVLGLLGQDLNTHPALLQWGALVNGDGGAEEIVTAEHPDVSLGASGRLFRGSSVEAIPNFELLAFVDTYFLL